MRLLFLILAHDRPEQAAELARTLVAAASDGIALIHYDVRSAEADHARLCAAVADEPRIRLVGKRAAGRWGSFGLVEAPLNALAEIEAQVVEGGLEPAYVILLSGACLPCRPVAALERYLAENAGQEFIEVADEGWIGNGWRSERWKYRFWFDHKTQHPAEWLSFQIQRRLGLERRFPEGLTPRFGSQWWALTWDTCRAMLLDMRRAPERLRFFRSVWIPDEMVVQTWVNALVHPDEIAGHGLTHFQFSNRGKPVVYHDDHLEYVRSLNAFFVRKVSPRAARLRAACLALAAEPDDGAPLDRIGVRRNDYWVKTAAQTHYPNPGHVFYRDQQADMPDTVLGRAEEPYVVLVGPTPLTRAVAACLPTSRFTALGEIFDPTEVDLGDGREAFGGLRRRDVAIRDLHPALFLVRLRARAERVPVILWSPFNQPWLLKVVLRDPRALVLSCLPCTGEETRDRRWLVLACRRQSEAERVPDSALSGLSPHRAARAEVDLLELRARGDLAPARGWNGHEFFALMRDGGCIELPWNLDDGANVEQRRRMFEASLAGSGFVAHPWFRSLERALRQLWDERLESRSATLLGTAAAGLLGGRREPPVAATGPGPEPVPEPEPESLPELLPAREAT